MIIPRRFQAVTIAQSERERPVESKRVAVYHRKNIMMMGGGEAVCLQTLEALKSEYDVTLLMGGGQGIDFTKLNEHFGANLKEEEINIRFVNPFPLRALRRLLKFVSKSLSLDTEFGNLSQALLDRYVNKIRQDYDLLICTHNETPFVKKTVDYIHFPTHYRDVRAKYYPNLKKRYQGYYFALYDWFVSLVSPGDKDNFEGKTTLVNSNWTREVVKEAFGADSEVLYPPVRTEDFNPSSWGEKGNGFVSIGRIERSKNQLRTIEILEALIEEGYKLHLHIIGSITNSEYAERVKEKAEKHSFIHLEGRIPREELVRLVEDHKFGIHGQDYEHFGIAVAEMVAGGCIPFVPNGGGQVDIVKGNSDLLYEDRKEAVEKISTMLDNPRLQKTTFENLKNRVERFSVKRFREEIKRIVDKKFQ